MDRFAPFHFLRPEWFYALFPLLLLMWLQWRRRLSSRSWQSVVAPRLLPHLLVGQGSGRRPWALLLAGIGGLLAIVAMAGPAWKKLEVPVYRQPSSLVLLLDMSRSMDAADIKPSRLLRAQMKLRDILAQRKEGDTALIVYAANAFVVSPLTPDASTIASQLDSLSSDLMPAQGSRPDRAIELALQLLQQSGVSHGGVLLVSDGIDGEESKELKSAIKQLVDAGHRLSVLGVGTPEGAPIATANGGFLKDSNGAIVLTRLDDTELDALARQGNGSYRRISTDDNDFHALLAPFENMRAQLQSKKVEGMNSDQWRDEGPWLLLPLLLLGALAFRRGYVVVLLLLVLPLPRPAHAFDWDSLWQRADQRGQHAMQAGDTKQAAALFRDPEWRAAANYRAGDYQAAAQSLKDIGSADADYNRGNALAKQGQLQEAINAYDAALKLDPKHADAKFNRDLLEEMLKQQQQDKQQNKNGKGQDKNQQQGSGKGQDKNQHRVAARARTKTSSRVAAKARTRTSSRVTAKARTKTSSRVTAKARTKTSSRVAAKASKANPNQLNPDLEMTSNRDNRTPGRTATKPTTRAGRKNPPPMPQQDKMARTRRMASRTRIKRCRKRKKTAAITTANPILQSQVNRTPANCSRPTSNGCAASRMIPVACGGESFCISTNSNSNLARVRTRHGNV